LTARVKSGSRNKFLVAHPADGRLEGCDRLRMSATAFDALSKHHVHFLERTLGTFAAAFAALERYHHEEHVIGPRCGRDFGRFRSLARLCWSAHLSRTRRLSVLVGLCRCSGWRADPRLLLAYPTLLGRLCLARAPRAYLRLSRSRLFRSLGRRTRMLRRRIPRRTPMGHCLPATRGALSVCDPRSVVMIDRLSVFGTFRHGGSVR
jgi:hypothetical protein